MVNSRQSQASSMKNSYDRRFEENQNRNTLSPRQSRVISHKRIQSYDHKFVTMNLNSTLNSQMRLCIPSPLISRKNSTIKIEDTPEVSEHETPRRQPARHDLNHLLIQEQNSENSLLNNSLDEQNQIAFSSLSEK